MDLPAEFVTAFMKKKEEMRTNLKMAAHRAVDQLYDFVLNGVERMIENMPESYCDQVEKSAFELFNQNNYMMNDYLYANGFPQQLAPNQHFSSSEENEQSWEPHTMASCSSNFYENVGDSNDYNNFETGYETNHNEPRGQTVPSKIFLGSTRNDHPSSDAYNGQYSPTSNYKTSTSVSHLSSNHDEEILEENTYKEPSIVKRFHRPSPEHNPEMFSDSDEDELETFKLVENYKIESLICLECEEEFVDQASLKEHLFAKHQTNPFVCPLQMCNKSFKYR